LDYETLIAASPKKFGRPTILDQTVTNSDLRLQTSDSEHEQEQEGCIRASSFLRHSSFVLRHSSVLYCCIRAAETATGKVQKYVLRGKPAISKQ
jgi:hypothetical protein